MALSRPKQVQMLLLPPQLPTERRQAKLSRCLVRRHRQPETC